MSTIVAVMDRPGFQANTDILVLVQPGVQRLLWVPRDLWCETLQDRINEAYKAGGPGLLGRALHEHGLQADHSLCLTRTATEAALEGIEVTVPVPARMEFSYPLTPASRIEDGSKQVTFIPPAEVLRGERIHQWIGARGGSDLHRIERQKVFLRRLLEIRFDFDRVMRSPEEYQLSGPEALEDLNLVRQDWAFETLSPIVPQEIAGKKVLVRPRP